MNREQLTELEARADLSMGIFFAQDKARRLEEQIAADRKELESLKADIARIKKAFEALQPVSQGA